ncbi:MAG: putative DNA-binding domain-containing protein [Holophagaceae bacterium]|nr:putative DNA-binding domain-containing protein [Holophagaceae bacterium]
MAERLLALQRTLADLLLDAEGRQAFSEAPEAFAAARGLDAADQQAFVRYRRRLLVYRELVQGALEDPLPDCFPFTHQILDEAGAWTDCVQAFIAARAVQSPYFRDINPTFVAWLAEGGWGKERWPFLLQLAHYEYIELDVLRWPEAPSREGLGDTPGADLRVAFDGAFRNLAYQWRVHESTEEAPVPLEGPAHLVCYRDRDLGFETLEVDPHTSAFLARCLEGQALGEAASGIGLDLPAAQGLLGRLRENGAVLGFS